MQELSYTLLADGSSDRALLPILTWAALRRAAGNPNGTQPLAMPDVQRLEELTDPKQLIRELLRQASGLQGRRLERFNWRSSAHRVAEMIGDFSPLYGLAAFQRLAAEVERVATAAEWR